MVSGSGKGPEKENLPELQHLVREAAREGKLSCREAFSVARRAGVSPMEVGRAADEAGIKICACQLGCF